MAFMYKCVAEHEIDVFICAQIGQPVPGKHALGADDQVFAKTLDGSQEVEWLGPHVPMQPLVPLTIEDAQVHPSGVQIDAAIEFVLLIVESHHGSPWEVVLEPLNHSKAQLVLVGQDSLSSEAMMSIRHESLTATCQLPEVIASCASKVDP